MNVVNQVGTVVPLLLAVVLLAGVPAFAQMDLTGVWNPRLADEENPERVAGKRSVLLYFLSSRARTA
jgi:hypothetical protein